MGHYINADGSYTSGDRCYPDSISVPERPSSDHHWVNGEWVHVQSVPQVVTRFQARAALLSTPSLHEGFSNMLEEVEAFMASGQVDPLARLAWTDAQEFKRQSPTILALAPLLDLSDDDLDHLFIAAAGVDA